MLAIAGVNVLSARLAEVFLGRLIGLDALGLYSRASGLNGLLSDNIHLIIARVMFVDFSEQKRRGIPLHDSYLHIVQVITGFLWPAFTGMAVIAGPLVLTLYGSAWLGAALPLSLLSISAVVLVSITMTWEVFVVSQETALQARFEFVRAGLGFALFAAGCLGGLNWAAAARIGEALFCVALYRPHLERMTGTKGSEFVPIYLHSLALTVVAVAPAAATMAYYGWSPAAPLPAVLGAVTIGFAAWSAMLVATRHPLAKEAGHWLRRLLPSRFARPGG
jgi:O-antigen/teichoic acid export membrane protein